MTQFTTGGVAAKVETVFNLSDLFLASLLGGFGCLTTGSVRFFDGLDNTDSNSLSHVTDGESTKWWVGGESFNAHWLKMRNMTFSRKIKSNLTLDGVILTIAASPDLTFFGKSSIFLPERLSIFSSNSVNLQAM